jgi:hypothetical protein
MDDAQYAVLWDKYGRLRDAALRVLSVGYVGNGRIVCPPIFLESLRGLAVLLNQELREAAGERPSDA